MPHYALDLHHNHFTEIVEKLQESKSYIIKDLEVLTGSTIRIWLGFSCFFSSSSSSSVLYSSMIPSEKWRIRRGLFWLLQRPSSACTGFSCRTKELGMRKDYIIPLRTKWGVSFLCNWKYTQFVLLAIIFEHYKREYSTCSFASDGTQRSAILKSDEVTAMVQCVWGGLWL
ncbi:hypothetical protein E2C01_010031 [Portunus trituberculatus]|uniref:Uncharacterized protein n=1 Tax=Portunus trituberculatus TaxID=210409 RepID=A0A5B7D7A4_PORTR|nr:hypothetical protein [Portunus trituberculatus]